MVGDFRYLAKMLMDVLALTKSGGGEGELHCLNLDNGEANGHEWCRSVVNLGEKVRLVYR